MTTDPGSGSPATPPAGATWPGPGGPAAPPAGATWPGFGGPAAPSPATGVSDPTAGGFPVAPGPVDPVTSPTIVDAPTPAPAAAPDTAVDPGTAARRKRSVGDVVTYEDFDYVTDRTTVRRALVVGVDEDVTVTNGDGADETVPALTVVFLGESVTLPAHAFED